MTLIGIMAVILLHNSPEFGSFGTIKVEVLITYLPVTKIQSKESSI